MYRWTATVLLACLIATADDAPKSDRRRINEIMVAAHLKPENRGTHNNLDNKLIDGKATEAEKQELLKLYQELAQQTPAKGDMDLWKSRTKELVDSVQAVIKGEKNAGERLKKARDCKSCHEQFRPKN